MGQNEIKHKNRDDFIAAHGLESVRLPSEEAFEMHKRGEEITIAKFSKYERNPFVNKLAKEGFSYGIRHTRVLENSVSMDLVSGSIDGELALGVRKKVDRGQFVKMFVPRMSALLGLSPAATKVFFTLMWQLQSHKGQDRVDLNLKIFNRLVGEAIEEFQERGEVPPKALKTLSKGTFYKAISELLQHNFIARSDVSAATYWLNADLVFNGDRIKLVEEYIIDAANRPTNHIDHEPFRDDQGDFGRLDDRNPYEGDE